MTETTITGYITKINEGNDLTINLDENKNKVMYFSVRTQFTI